MKSKHGMFRMLIATLQSVDGYLDSCYSELIPFIQKPPASRGASGRNT